MQKFELRLMEMSCVVCHFIAVAKLADSCCETHTIDIVDNGMYLNVNRTVANKRYLFWARNVDDTIKPNFYYRLFQDEFVIRSCLEVGHRWHVWGDCKVSNRWRGRVSSCGHRLLVDRTSKTTPRLKLVQIFMQADLIFINENGREISPSIVRSHV